MSLENLEFTCARCSKDVSCLAEKAIEQKSDLFPIDMRELTAFVKENWQSELGDHIEIEDFRRIAAIAVFFLSIAFSPSFACPDCQRDHAKSSNAHKLRVIPGGKGKTEGLGRSCSPP